MFVYALTTPIDFFDGIAPLPQWIANTHDAQAAWALRAVLALADAAEQVGWDGDMRHLPSVGCLPTPPDVTPYLLVKQDNNGTTFVISDAELPWLEEQCDRHASVMARPVGAWTHTLTEDLRTHTNLADYYEPVDPFRQF